MSFLDEATIKTTPENLPKVKQQAGEDDTIEVMEKKGKDLDGDGDIDSDDYLAARDAAIKKAMSMKEGVTKDLYIKAMEASSLEEFITDVYEDYPQHENTPGMEEFLTKYYIDLGGPIDEGKASKFLAGAAIVASLLGINKAASEKIYDSSPKIKSLTTKYEAAKEKGDKEAMAKFEDEIKAEKIKIDKGLDEAKTVELPADTTFTLDLKHLMKKHIDEGKSQEDVVKLTKALMKKLHDKGEVKVDGTKVIFKEAFARSKDNPFVPDSAAANSFEGARKKAKESGEDTFKYAGKVYKTAVKEQEDTQLALPEPDAPDFLGDDGMDYEGGMAKSQMLKMKKYAAALCDMIEDESQLEAWVQAKLTKASDYMSAVFHYLDYQKSKMNEDLNLNPRTMDTDEALVSILMGRGLGEESAEQVIDGLSNEDFKKAGLMMIKGVDERQIAKFILSATTLDEGYEGEFKPLTQQEKDTLVKIGKL